MSDFYYRKLVAYQTAKQLVKMVYAVLRNYPSEERHALCAQLRRSVVSIPSNIAEGMGRFSLKERIHFVEISYGSLCEVMCQMEISLELGYINAKQMAEIEKLATETGKTLSGLRKSLVEKLNRYNNPEERVEI